ncbi:MAG: hypothetical protein KF866_05500 [Phycisphaeraceae bacterium]|nr:hypothetical protein [Phycisphaeraceae bacterium]MCW5754448.1 hypothetical protein [Phycisphaeraceae bacterium]
MSGHDPQQRIDRLEEELLYSARQNEQMHELLLLLHKRFDELTRRVEVLERRTAASTQDTPSHPPEG